MPSLLPCPACGKYHFHKSHTKNFYEKSRKKILSQHPYRCHNCGYRTWTKSSILKPKATFKQALIYFIVFVVAVLISIILKNFLI